MTIGIRIGVPSRGNGAIVATSPLTISGLTAGEARIGTTLTAQEDGGVPTGSIQWQADGVDIPGGISATYVTSATYDGQALTWTNGTADSASAPIRYAPGSVTESALANWVIDDDVLNLNLASDFTIPNLGGSFAISGLPAGAIDDGDGSISGTIDGELASPAAETVICTHTDKYGRQTIGTYPVNTVYRDQAVAGAGPDLTLTVGVDMTPVDLAANWTLNGNTMTWLVSPALVDELAVDPSSALMSGAPDAVVADATYTLTGTDEYGREVSGTFMLETEAAPVGVNPVVTGQTYTEGSPGVAAQLEIRGNPNGGTEGLRLFLGSGLATATVTQAELIAGAGGTDMLQFAEIDPFTFDGGNYSLSAFTNNEARKLFYVVVQATSPGTSGVQSLDVTNLAPPAAAGFATASDLWEFGALGATEITQSMNIGAASASRRVLFLVGMEGGTGEAPGFDFTVNGTSYNNLAEELGESFQSNASITGYDVPIATGETATVGLTHGSSGSSTANTVIAIPHTGNVVTGGVVTDYEIGTALAGTVETVPGGSLHILLFGRDETFDNGTITITDPAGAVLDTTIVVADDIVNDEHPSNINSGRAYLVLEGTPGGTVNINLATTAAAPSRWTMIAVALDS